MIENIYMTSFQRSHGQWPALSVAMYQPKGFSLERVDWALIGNPDGSDWIRPRNFIDHPDPLHDYRTTLRARYESRISQAKLWCDHVGETFQGVVFCCWCPYDRAAKRQMEEWGSYVCHTDVLGEWIEDRLGIRVWYDSDRRKMKALI